MRLLPLAQRYAAAAWQHRWKALALCWAVCLLGWAAVYAIPNQFQARARIYADADLILGEVMRGIAPATTPAGQVEMLQRTLLSRPNLEKVVARTDLNLRATDRHSHERLVDSLRQQIRLLGQTRNLFAIEYQDTDPRLARDVVQTVVNLFIESATGTDRQQMENARNFVAQQIASYESQLREAERRRAEFQARYVDLLPSDALGGVSSLEAARGRLQALQGELQDARMRRERTRSELERTPAENQTAERGGGDGGGPAGLADAERRLRELRLQYTDQHPDVIAALNMVRDLRASGGRSRGAAAPRSAPRQNPLHEQLRVRLLDADAQVASLERQVRDGEAEVERLDEVARTVPEVQAQYTNLDRDYAVLRRNYEELLARREAIQIAGAARTSSDRVRLEVVEPPVVPSLPVWPNRMLLLSGVLVVGLAAGGGLAVLLVLLDDGFYTVQDLRRLGLPVLGAISAPPAPPRRAAAAAFAGGLVLLLLTYGAMVAGAPGMLARMVA